jgi:hypothetical protein
MPSPATNKQLPALVGQVAGILAPEFGESMARAAVRVHLQKAGVSLTAFRKVHLADLASRLRPGLLVFLGAERTEALVTQVQDLARTEP